MSHPAEREFRIVDQDPILRRREPQRRKGRRSARPSVGDEEPEVAVLERERPDEARERVRGKGFLRRARHLAAGSLDPDETGGAVRPRELGPLVEPFARGLPSSRNADATNPASFGAGSLKDRKSAVGGGFGEIHELHSKSKVGPVNAE